MTRSISPLRRVHTVSRVAPWLYRLQRLGPNSEEYILTPGGGGEAIEPLSNSPRATGRQHRRTDLFDDLDSVLTRLSRGPAARSGPN